MSFPYGLVVAFNLFIAAANAKLRVKGNNTQYDFFAGLGGPVRVPGFYEKNETKQFYSKLGEACDWSDNCFPAFTICKLGKCACDGAFQAVNGVCQPKTVYCPDPKDGSAKAITTPKFCHIENLNSTIQHSGCSPDEFCFLHPSTKTSWQNFYPSGHCCQLLTSETKLSQPVCPFVLKDDVFNQGNKNCEQCELMMEQCVSFKVWNTEMSYTYVGRCCPLPCRDAVHSSDQLFNLDGQCFYHRKLVKVVENLILSTSYSMKIQENCDYGGLDIALNDKKLQGLTSYQCEYECLRNILCTHFTWSQLGCFLKRAETDQQILATFVKYDGAICGIIDGRTRPVPRVILRNGGRIITN